VTGAMIHSTPDLMSGTEALEHFRDYGESKPVLPTGFPMWDQACRGFGRKSGIAFGWYVVIGGDTGQGKSLLGLQLGVQAIRAGFRPGFVSLEMSVPEIRNRAYSQLIGIDSSDLEPGPFFRQETAQMISDWLDRWRDERGYSPFFAVSDLDPTVHACLALMDSWRQDEGVDVFVVDYLQLLEDPETIGSAREIQRISKAMRDYAHRHGVIVIGLSQYNNEGGNDRTRPPHVGHLYGGRRISQDSDQTILLDHSRVIQDRDLPHITRTFAMLPKNRHGPKGFEIPIEWNFKTLTARQALPDEENLWPQEHA
jgi:replicative DNA helicase